MSQDRKVPRCDGCRLTESELKVKLKRCAGCSATMYCSRECQKQDWLSSHKAVCRAEWLRAPPPPVVVDPGATDASVVNDSDLGIPSESVAALDTALLAWLQTHHYGFMVLATATVYLNGGYALHFSPDAPRAITISVKSMPKALTSMPVGPSSDNPGKGFHILSSSSVPNTTLLEEYGPGFNWDEAQSACQDMEGKIQDVLGDTFRIHALPGIFHIKNSPVMRIRPIMATELPGRSGTLDAETRAMLEDVRTFCMGLMLAGFVLHMPSAEHGGSPLPRVGSLVRRKKKQWEWEPVPVWDWGRAAAALVPRELWKTDLPPEELWRRFYYG
ncbi:hypothetical protein VTO73DRAFT_14319 [Trametes versicolor]